MPTTYTNGLKLPDLGSIDWFNAYKNNIDILDPIVGTVNGVATTYAPISHNHDASEITSGTIDIARLPPAALERLTTVADQTARYALTTSTVQLGDTVKQLDTGIMYLVVDITKLNSADGYVEYSAGTASKAIADEDGTNIKTGYVNRTTNQSIAGQKTFFDNTFFPSPVYHKNTTYEIGNIPASNIVTNIYLADKNNVYTSFVRSVIYASGRTATEIRAKNAFKNGVLDPTGADISSNLNVEVQPNGTKTIYWDGLIRNDVTPFTTNNNSLGSSTNQWSSVYAQSYYYNGTAWGLDKYNVWTDRNIYENSALTIRSNNIQGTTAPSTNIGIGLLEVWNKDNHYWGGFGYKWLANGNSELIISLSNWNGNTQGYWEYKIGANKAFNDLYFAPPHNLVNLGTSTNKWKTLNGINPGALSLPDYDSSAKIDISGSIIPDQYNNIYYTPTINGWLYVCFDVSSATTSDPIFYIQAKDSNVANSSFVQTSWRLASAGTSSLAIFFPVVANKQFIMQINFSSYTIIKAHVIPCLGNV